MDFTPKQKILVVDDESHIRRGLVSILERAGYDLFEAIDNAGAILILRKQKFDLVFSDLNRPGGSGEDLLKAVETDPMISPVPVMILSGDARPNRELECYRLGARRVLWKPFEKVELLAWVGRVLGNRRDPDLLLVELRAEGRDLDYKKHLDLNSSSGRAMLAREVLAMANSGGGALVIGVAEVRKGEFQRFGVAEDELEKYETTRINDSIRRYVGSGVSLSSRVVRSDGLAFVVIRVAGVEDTIALAAAGNENVGLHPGRIYVRGDDARSSEIVDPLQLQRMVDRLVAIRLRNISRKGAG